MAVHYLALDVHCSFCEMAVMTSTGKLVLRDRCETRIPALREAIAKVRRPRRLTFEEGPLADWLARELRGTVDELVVCEPRRNHWIARDGDKDDPIDARKLADLYRGGYLKAVRQSQSLGRSLLKQQVSLYHDRVRERVRQGNQLVALFRRHGIFFRATESLNDEQWVARIDQLPKSQVLRQGLDLVRQVYVQFTVQEEILRAGLIRLAKQEEPVRRFEALPGMGWIRSITFYAYIDCPHRFHSKAALWRYSGIGLERRHSGRGPVQTRLSRQGNRRLKNVLMGAAQAAIAQGENPFADKYRHWTQEKGIPVPNARRNIARAMGATMWSLWKTGQTLDAQRVAIPSLAVGVE
ncbi:MAG: transposase [Bythopirellula sp.]